ncbi:MAG: hypothetical protein ACK4M7_05480, partial [Burkholderiales bacterium]
MLNFLAQRTSMHFYIFLTRLVGGFVLCVHLLTSCQNAEINPIKDCQRGLIQTTSKQHAYSWGDLVNNQTELTNQNESSSIKPFIQQSTSFKDEQLSNRNLVDKRCIEDYISPVIDCNQELAAEKILSFEGHEVRGSVKSANCLEENRFLPYITSSALEDRLAPIKELLDKPFTMSGGEQVSFYIEDGLFKAKVVEAIGVFRRSLILPVYFEKAIGSFSSKVGRQVHIVYHNQSRDKGSYIYIGNHGLPGGMKEGKEEEEVCTSKSELVNESITISEEEIIERPTKKSSLSISLLNLGDFTVLGRDVLGIILDQLGAQERGYMRQLNRSFYQLLSGYSAPGIIGLEHKSGDSLHQLRWSLERTINAAGFNFDTIPSFVFYRLLEKVKDLPSVFWPYLKYS